MPKTAEKDRSKASTYKCHGIELTNGNGDQLSGTCPFCDKEDHFYVNASSGQYSCKSCSAEGNVVTFLTEFSRKVHEGTKQTSWDRLSTSRGIPQEVLRSHRLGWNDGVWLIPVYSETGTVRDIRRWDGVQTMSTTGCHLNLYGLETLAKVMGEHRRVWVCEGEWDAIAMRWLLDLAGLFQDVVVGVPGAGSFKDEWVKWFVGHDVILCFDNDDAGDKGSLKAGQKLVPAARTILYLCWPETRPLGWDIRDFVKDGRGSAIPAVEGIRILESLLSPKHRRSNNFKAPAAASAAISGEDAPATKFKDVLKVFEKWVIVDTDFENALAIALATVATTELVGDPVWMYIVGPPSSGKTVILTSLKNHAKVFFQSTFTPASLISGYNANPDPSIIPKMDGKTAVFKDGTELLAMHPDARREAYGTLRGAYDGTASKPFGNSVGIRSYKCHFNMLIGVTPAVHGDNQASMGERFLKFEMRENLDTVGPKILRSIDNIGKEVEMEAETGAASMAFLRTLLSDSTCPKMPDRYRQKMVAIAQLLSVMRAEVPRDPHSDEIKYRPTSELGTRIAKQLSKLAMGLAYLFDKPEVDDSIYEIIEKVATDSMIGFHADIVITTMNSGVKGLTRDTIAKEAKIPDGTCHKRLADMQHLGIMQRFVDPDTSRPGPKPALWRVTKKVRDLWYTANFFYRRDIKGYEPKKLH